MNMRNFSSEVQCAIRAAIAATSEIMDVYINDFETIIKQDGSPVTEADIRSSRVIEEGLQGTNIPIIGEEMINRDYAERKDWVKCWIIDPVDGTREFVNRNDEFSINIGLVENGNPIFGLIASPVQKYMLLGGKDMGLFELDYSGTELVLSSLKINHNESAQILVLTSRSHDSGLITNYLENLQKEYGELTYLRKGSALKFIDLVKQIAQAYPRFAPTMEWDVAAGQALLEAAGGQVLNATTGFPLTYNKPNLSNPYFIAENFL